MDNSKDNSSLTNSVKVEQLPPLENPLIVDVLAYQVCQMSDTDDIKNFRLVCKLWRDAIPERWKSDFRIHKICQHANPTDKKGSDNENDAITLEQLRDLPDYFKLISTGSTEIQFWELEECHFIKNTSSKASQVDLETESDPESEPEPEPEPEPQQQSLENWFWASCGPLITSIAIIKCHFDGPFTIFGDTFLKAVPNLKTLRIINCNISVSAWEKIIERYRSQREFYEHVNLKRFYLDVDATDEQFDLLWSPFQRSLINLEHVSVKRIKRTSSSYSWVGPLVRYWNSTESMKTLTFGESSGDICELDLYKLSISRSVINKAFLEVYWYVSVNERLDYIPYIPYLTCPFRELHLWGQVFPNLCFLKDLEDLRLLVWNSDEGEDSDDDENNSVETMYDIKSYSCVRKGGFPDSIEIYVDRNIKIGCCDCPIPVEREIPRRVCGFVGWPENFDLKFQK